MFIPPVRLRQCAKLAAVDPTLPAPPRHLHSALREVTVTTESVTAAEGVTAAAAQTVAAIFASTGLSISLPFALC
jgi:hypothetical protein